jgi:hypothetical protein
VLVPAAANDLVAAQRNRTDARVGLDFAAAAQCEAERFLHEGFDVHGIVARDARAGSWL